MTVRTARVDLHLPAQDGRSGRDLLAQSFAPPAFPITPEGLQGRWAFHAMSEGRHRIEGFDVVAVDVQHKGGRTFGLRVDDDHGSFAYLPDHAPMAGTSAELMAMLQGVDVLLHDAQFLEGERPVAVDYGHSTVQDAVVLPRPAVRASSCCSTTRRPAPTTRSTRSQSGHRAWHRR